MVGKIPPQTIVCLRADEDHGKSETIKALFRLLVQNAKEEKTVKWYRPNFRKETPYRERLEKIAAPQTGICMAKTVKRKRVGLNSHGDDKKDVRKCLEKLVKKEPCDIIFCTCRGNNHPTEKVVKKIAEEFNYTIIWTAPYTLDTDTAPKGEPLEQYWKELNQKKAEHLMDFI